MTPSDRQLERDTFRRRRSLRRGAVAAGSTIVVIGVIAVLVVSSPGWDRV